jgi:hypothetical protein
MAKINKLILKVVLFAILLVNTAFAEAPTIKKDDIKYPEQVVQLANKIDEKFKKKYYLEYASKEQLLSTLNNIYWRADKNFKFEKLTAMAIQEGKLNPYATNRRDGTKGIFQVKDCWRKHFPWYTNPYDTFQSTQAAVNILTYNKIHFKCSSDKAIELFNGTNRKKTKLYIARVNAIYKDICRT